MKETAKQFNDTNIAVVAIVVCQESCLFLQRKHAPKNWCPPCGRLKDNEDPLQGLKREALEETGLEIIPLMCVDAWMGLHNGKNIFSVTYVCTAESLQVTLSSEHSAFLWIPIRDLLDRKIDTDFSIQKWPSLIKAALALTHENPLTTPHFVNGILDRAPEKKFIEFEENSIHNYRIQFQKATLRYSQDVLQWLSEPHVQEFWDNSPEHAQDILIFMKGRSEPSPYWNGMFDYWIGTINDEPYCLLMTSEVLSSQSDLSDLWREYLSKTGRTFSIDFMIGNKKFLGKGLGGSTLEAFMKFIQENVDQSIDTFLIDPAESNPKAKHVYEKGGFTTVATFYRDCREEENVKHFLMVKHMPERKFIEIDGFRFQIHIEGQGPTVLVIGSALYYPRSFSQELCSQFRMVFIDWRGFAKQETTKEQSVSFDTLLADIEKIRNALQIKSCILIGHSAHALLALEYAKKYPHAVSHLIMIGASPNLSQTMHEAASRNWDESVWPERKEASAKRLQNLPDEELGKLSPPERFVAWYVRRDPQAWYDFNFDSSKLWEGILPNMPLFDYLYGVALRDLDITKGLDSFNRPVFLALGRYDFIVAPPSSWDPFRAKFKDFTCRVFERSGHSPQYEEAHNFNKELMQWLELNR